MIYCTQEWFQSEECLSRVKEEIHTRIQRESDPELDAHRYLEYVTNAGDKAAVDTNGQISHILHYHAMAAPETMLHHVTERDALAWPAADLDAAVERRCKLIRLMIGSWKAFCVVNQTPKEEAVEVVARNSMMLLNLNRLKSLNAERLTAG